MLHSYRVPTLASLAIIGIACAGPGSRLIIPPCPMPSAGESQAIQQAAETIPGYADLERRRIVHCCRLEVLRESDGAATCAELIEELSG